MSMTITLPGDRRETTNVFADAGDAGEPAAGNAPGDVELRGTTRTSSGTSTHGRRPDRPRPSRPRTSMSDADLLVWLERTTNASQVPLVLEDAAVIAQIAMLVAA